MRRGIDGKCLSPFSHPLKMNILVVLIFGCISGCSAAREQSTGQEQEQPSGIISGTVVNEHGQPVAGAKVNAQSNRPTVGMVRFVETDGAGRFAVDRLTWGKYSVCARKEADGYAEICGSILRKDNAPTATLSAQSPSAQVLVVIGPKAGVIVGSLTDAATGAPVDASLRIRLSNDNGRFFEPGVGPQFSVLIPPNADLEVEARAPWYRLWRFSVDGNRRGSPLRVKSGERRALNIRLWHDLR